MTGDKPNLDRIFYPRGIAVIGGSSNPKKFSFHWIRGLLDVGYQGGVYPVNPGETEILGRKSFAKISDIPGPVDLAIICTPRKFALSLMDELAAKGVFAAHYFTGGFRETGKAEDRLLEEELARKASAAGVRIIGPNCMGIYNPEARIPWGPSDLLGIAGHVGLVSQSGGHAVKMAEIGLTCGINFSKMVSYGNGADLEGAAFIDYLGSDPKTTVIGAYLEGCRDGIELARVLRKVTPKKPVVVWKGGRTVQGAETAASHTGSMVASADTWSAVLQQCGAIQAKDMEELADTLLLLQHVRSVTGKRVGVVCGLTDGGGGESVLSADSCADYGIEVPRFSPKARTVLSEIFGEIGSVLRNPLDVSQGYGDVSKLARAMDIVFAEPQIDAVVVYENVDILVRFLSRDLMDQMNALFLELRKRDSKPLICVLPPGADEDEWLRVRRVLVEGGIPVFNSTMRAARALSHVTSYLERVHRTA